MAAAVAVDLLHAFSVVARQLSLDWSEAVEHIDPSTDEEARTYLLDHGSRGMPVVRTSDGQLAWGAEPQQLADALPILGAATATIRYRPAT